MSFEFVLTKMKTELQNPVQYYLSSDSDFINLNQLLGKEITIEHVGYQCLNCNSEKKIFRQGFCYDCFYKSPLAGDWIMKPELSRAHLDIEDRDLEYEKQVQLQPHIVYLSLSSEIKVGVTRKSQVPYRWIDQGAVQAIQIVEVPNRYLAGITEVALKNHFADKTNFRKMLSGDIPEVNLIEERNKLKDLLPEEIKPYFDNTMNELTEIHFPVNKYPEKVNSLNIDVNPIFKGKLVGVKAQYLLFEDQTVFNVRSYEGYKVEITI